MMRHAIALLGLAFAFTVTAGEPPPTCREDARVEYNDPADPAFGYARNGRKVVLGAIDWDSTKQESVKDLEKNWSLHRTRWYIQTVPDTMRPGPWTTNVYVLGRGGSDRPLHIRVDDHKAGGVKLKWINENLLFVEVWWGTLGATDYILDIENKKWLYAMDANFTEVHAQCD